MRKTVFKLHSYVALVSLIPLLIVSLTGSILVFKTEIDQWLMPGVASLNYSGQHDRKSFDELIKTVEEAQPNFIVGSWELFNDGVEADRVYLIKKGTDDWYKAYFDPFGNKLLSEPVLLHSDLTDWLLHLHYTFLLNDIGGEHSQFGTLIGLIAAIFMTFLGITGLIIHRKFWQKFFALRWGKNLRIFSGDFHRLVGLWSSPVILVLGITGLYFNAEAYYHEVFEHGEEEHYHVQQRLYSPDIEFDKLLEDSQSQLKNFTPTYLLFPFEPEVNITVFGHQPGLNPFASNYASTVTYDKQSGKLLAAIDGRESAAVIKVLDSFRELHFGSFAGLISKIVWCILGLSPIILGLTGIYIWQFRKLKNRKGLRRGAVSENLSQAETV